MSFTSRYSRLDRLLHDLAFAGLGVQKAVAEVEDRVYARRCADVSIDRPVFVTSLPRAGTTLLLEVLSSLDCFAAHTYREMPFVLCPLMWDTLSRRFRQSAELRERAHGDGMAVGYDSVEAFEEVLWRAFWPEKYQDARIVPWHKDEVDADAEFEAFFASHIRKLITLRRNGRGDGMPERYVSKNNANVARLGTIRRIFPDAVVLVPFRDPVDHVGSMLRQHHNFLELHASDPFARRYMESIGHLEFGELLRPIDFSGWLDAAGPLDPKTADFWLEYWCRAFEQVLSDRGERVVLLAYERVCDAPEDAMSRVGEAVGLDDAAPLVAQAARFRAPSRYDPEALRCAAARLGRAREIHARLLDASIV